MRQDMGTCVHTSSPFTRCGWCSPQWPTLEFWSAAGCRSGSFLEVSWKFTAQRLQARLHHNGARQPKSKGTFLLVVFSPGLIGAVRNSPFSSFGVRPAGKPAAWADYWKFPGIFPQHACGPGCTTMGQDSPNLRALSYRWFFPPD